MFVRYKKEIVHLGLEDNDFDNDINPLETTGAYLSPKEFKEALGRRHCWSLDTVTTMSTIWVTSEVPFTDIRNFRELPHVRDITVHG